MGRPDRSGRTLVSPPTAIRRGELRAVRGEARSRFVRVASTTRHTFERNRSGPVRCSRAGSVVPNAATWVTRRGIHVDQMASARLIRRFIDPKARFRLVDPRTYQHEAGEYRFDMFEAEFTHEGDLCTFEVLLLRFRLEAPALQAIAEMVHDIDLKDTTFARPETAGFERAIAGIALARIIHGADLKDLGAAPECPGLLTISRGFRSSPRMNTPIALGNPDGTSEHSGQRSPAHHRSKMVPEGFIRARAWRVPGSAAPRSAGRSRGPSGTARRRANESPRPLGADRAAGHHVSNLRCARCPRRHVRSPVASGPPLRPPSPVR